jgi:hypothetical protein
MIIPIVEGMLYSTKQSMINALGGYEKITFEQFSRIYVEHPGDYGICFEYAVHQAIKSREPGIHPLLSEVLNDFCGIKGSAESILFGAERAGATRIIETAKDLLTDESRILGGKRGQPPRLKNWLEDLFQAFRNAEHRERLPESIRGAWKADLIVGSPGPDQWVATTLKTRREHLEAAPGLRIGLYPEERRGQGPEVDDDRNLVLCPLPYSGEFMQLFGASFQIVKQIIAAQGKQPSRVALVYDDDQQVAKWLADRKSHPVLAILEALEPIKQPDFLTQEEEAEDEAKEPDDDTVAAAPIPLNVEQ